MAQVPTLEDMIQPSITPRPFVKAQTEPLLSEILNVQAPKPAKKREAVRPTAQEQVVCVRTPECSSYEPKLHLKLLQKRLGKNYRYEPQVKATCGKCGRYIKFVRQVPEVMDRINEKLEGMSF